MATTFPQDYDEIALKPEREVFARLADSLDDKWMLFHGVDGVDRFSAIDRPWEIDILLVHQTFGLVVIEVKGGPVTYSNGQWVRSNKQIHPNPIDQARNGSFSLRRHLADRLKIADSKLPTCFAIALPDAFFGQRLNLPGGILRDQILDRLDLKDARQSVEALVANTKQRGTLSETQLRRIRTVLRPTDDQRTKIVREVNLSERELRDAIDRHVVLTDEQVEAQNALAGYRRAAVVGPAGTGKTLLAAHRAKTLAEESRRPLFLTPSVPVQEMLATSRLVVDLIGVDCHTLASLTKRVSISTGVPAPEPPPFESRPQLLRFHRELAEYFLTVVADHDWSSPWSALVIDEAQAIEADLLYSLRLLLTDGDHDPVYLFADPTQRVEAGEWKVPRDFASLSLVVNCRNTENTGRFAEACTRPLRFHFLTGGGVPPRMRIVDRTTDEINFTKLITTAMDELDTLITLEKIDPDQITVVAPSDVLDRGQLIIEETFPGVQVKPIREFRGCEAPVIVAVLVRDSRESRYVATTRARSLLVVVADERVFLSDDVAPSLREAAQALAADSAGRPRPIVSDAGTVLAETLSQHRPPNH